MRTPAHPLPVPRAPCRATLVVTRGLADPDRLVPWTAMEPTGPGLKGTWQPPGWQWSGASGSETGGPVVSVNWSGSNSRRLTVELLVGPPPCGRRRPKQGVGPFFAMGGLFFCERSFFCEGVFFCVANAKKRPSYSGKDCWLFVKTRKSEFLKVPSELHSGPQKNGN